MKFIVFMLLTVNFAHAYTLNNNFGGAFKAGKVKVYVDAGTTCDNLFFNSTELQAMIEPAVDKYWNKVPTANLELKASGFSEAVFTMNHGKLCSPTDEQCITDANSEPDLTKRVIPPVSDIVIACNDNFNNFGGFNVLAVTVPNKFDGKTIKGAVILLNNYTDGSTDPTLNNFSRSEIIAVIAHEIGHALGLGHSTDSEALMLARAKHTQNKLGQDDFDGITYLYPMKFDMGGLLGGCGTISDGKNPPKDPPFWQMGITLGLMILIFQVLKLLGRPKARASL